MSKRKGTLDDFFQKCQKTEQISSSSEERSRILSAKGRFIFSIIYIMDYGLVR